jgi:hypothetical protein
MALGLLASTSAADFSAVWGGGNGNWSDPLLWNTNPNYPNNTGGVTYDAVISGGSVTLDRDITIQRLFYNAGIGTLRGASQLTLNEGMTWDGGQIALSPGGAINLAAGSTSTISNVGSNHFFNSGTMNNAGAVNLAQSSGLFGANGIINNLAGGSWTIQAGSILGNFGVFNNAGNFTASFVGVSASPFVDCVFNNSGIVTIPSGGAYRLSFYRGGSASGTFIVPTETELRFSTISSANTYTLTSGASITGGGSTTINDTSTLDIAGSSAIGTSLTNRGTLTVQSGATLTLSGGFSQSGTTRLNGGTITSIQPLSFSGTLTGSGTIHANVNLSVNSILAFQLGGTMAGSGFNNYDSLSINGSFALAGNLNLTFKNDFANSVTGSDNFALLTSGSGLTGSFSNVASGSRLDTTDGFGSFIVTYGSAGLSLSNFVRNTTWLGGSGNWANGANWSSNPAYPNNDDSTQYSAVVQSGTVSLDTNITVSRLLLTGGNLAGGNSLTVNDAFIWSSGTISGLPGSSINLGTGSTSTISNASPSTFRILNGRTLNNAGLVEQRTVLYGNGTINNLFGATWKLGTHLLVGTFNNAGSLVDEGSYSTGVQGVFNNSGSVALVPGPVGSTTSLSLEGGGTASGRFTVPAQTSLHIRSAYTFTTDATVTGAGSTVVLGSLTVEGNSTIDTTLINQGTLTVAAGTALALAGSFTQNTAFNSPTLINNGTIANTQPLNFQSGNVIGTGTITGSVINNATISPGTSAGTLTINGNLSLLSNSKIVMEIGGVIQGAQYDYLPIGGTVGLDGTLELRMLNSFQLQLDPSQTFTLLTSNSLLSGAFDNVANGARLVSADGTASFQVNYGAGSPFGADNLVLSDPIRIIPEPASLMLFAGGAAILGLVRFRRR